MFAPHIPWKGKLDIEEAVKLSLMPVSRADKLRLKSLSPCGGEDWLRRPSHYENDH